MQKRIFLAVLAACALSSAEAIVVVNGVPGEDADNASPFETLQAAVDYANNGAETVIQVQVTAPIAGASLAGKVINHPLTIQSAPGTFPTLVTGLDLQPTTGTQLVTLSGLNVSTTGLNTPLIAGTSILANNCIFNTNPKGGGADGPAVSAAVPGPTTTGSLAMTSCTLIGHVGLMAGRVCKDYVLTRCEVIGKPTDSAPVFSVGIFNAMNWHGTFAYRMGAANGFDEIQDPRTVTLDTCVVRGGVPLGWPNSLALDGAYFQNENRTIGPIKATNTVFEALDGIADAESSRIGSPSLPPNQNASSTFTHCTFRCENGWGFFYFPGGQPATHTFTDCLFDMMNGAYGIYDPNPTSGNVILAGDANSYHVPAGTEVYGRPPFEATKHFYIGNTAVAPNLTNKNGGLLLNHPQVCAQAVATVPPTALDKDGNPRPLPVSALASDIGADEVDETAPAGVAGWTLY